MADNSSSPRTALGAAVLGIGFTVFVALVPGLNTNPFMQGVTGLVLAACIAVALFSAVPSSAWIKVPVSLGGAAAFFFLILPPLERFIFPSRTITGTVYYVNTTTPVAAVAIRNPDTKQEVKTDDRGDFTLPNVPWSVSSLVATSGGKDYALVLNPEKKYPIIQQLPETTTTPKQTIASSEWSKHQTNNCPQIKSTTPSHVDLFSLTESIPVTESYSKLYIQVSTLGTASLVHAEKIKPPPGTGGEAVDDQTPGADRTKARRWWIPVTARPVDLELQICVNTKDELGGNNPNAFETFYWFTK